MRKGKIELIVAAAITLSVFLLGVSVYVVLDSDFGRVDVSAVLIPDGDKELAGLLYRPVSASALSPAPGVVLAHGIAGCKEMMSGIGLELARRGFVSLCLDLLGHGGSDGTVAEGADEHSFGVLSAVKYLRFQSFVNSSAIGLVGHSLGAGAVRATFVTDNRILASVLVAGGVGNVSEDATYGILTPDFPSNLLVIVGRYDVLFDLTQLETEELPSAFGVDEQVVPEVLYGSFSSQTARKLVVPSTTHLFEPVDSEVVSEICTWMEQAFDPHNVSAEQANPDQLYIGREAADLAGLIGFLGVVFVASLALGRFVKPDSEKEASRKNASLLRSWKVFGIWGILGLSLFLPVSFVGFAIAFPPLIFGASIAWWAFFVGFVGLVLSVWVLPRFSITKFGFKDALVETFNKNHVLVAVALFLLMFAIVSLLQGLLNVNLRIVSPLFRSLTSTRRILSFFALLPFLIVYFSVEGMYFFELRAWAGQKQGFVSEAISCIKPVFGKVAPFLTVICVQYTSEVLFGLWVFPNFAGFFIEFLWLIVPIFVIATVCSWWFYRNSRNIWSGAVFNALMMAWVASTTFPF